MQQRILDAQTPEQLNNIMNELEENFEVEYDIQIANLQLFSYILIWDIVNARFLYYKYKNIFDSDAIAKEQVQFIKCVFENKYFEMKKASQRLVDVLTTRPIYKKWLETLKLKVNAHLKEYVEKNYQTISADHSNQLGFQAKGFYVQVKEEPPIQEPIDIQKLTKLARMIQNMNNK